MKSSILYITISLFLLSCGGNENRETILSAEETTPETAEANPFKLKINQEILNNIQNALDTPSEQSFITVYNGENEKILDEGVMFRKIENDLAYEVFNKYSHEVRAEGNYLFLTNIDYDKDMNTFFDIAILPCKDQFELIKMIGTKGTGEDISNQEIIDKMMEWDQQVGFNVLYVDNTGIDAYMDHLPEDVEKFANEVAEFCPFVIEEDFKSIEAFVADLEKNKYFYLWWGVSFR